MSGDNGKFRNVFGLAPEQKCGVLIDGIVVTDLWKILVAISNISLLASIFLKLFPDTTSNFSGG